MNHQEWYQSGYFRKVADHEIFIKKSSLGHGPFILLLHGFPSSSWDWYKMWGDLSKEYNVIALDFLGFGKSDKPYPHSYSIHEQTDIVEQIMLLEEIKVCYIVAHDYAVSVAQELIARTIDQTALITIEKIILLNGGLFPSSHHPRLIQKLLLSPIGFIINRLLSKKSLKKNFDAIFGPETKATDQEIETLWQIINLKNGKRVFHLLIKYMNDRVYHAERWEHAIVHSPIPLTLINGPEDPISGRHLAETYRAKVAHPDIIFLDKIGHYPNIEAPNRLLHYIREKFFIDEFS